jgi:hypothetical protein
MDDRGQLCNWIDQFEHNGSDEAIAFAVVAIAFYPYTRGLEEIESDRVLSMHKRDKREGNRLFMHKRNK